MIAAEGRRGRGRRQGTAHNDRWQQRTGSGADRGGGGGGETVGVASEFGQAAEGRRAARENDACQKK